MEHSSRGLRSSCEETNQFEKCGEVDVTSRYDDRGTLSQRCRASPTKYDQYTLIFHSARGDGGKGTSRKDEGICFRNTRLSATVSSTYWLPLTLLRSLLLSVSAYYSCHSPKTGPPQSNVGLAPMVGSSQHWYPRYALMTRYALKGKQRLCRFYGH